MGQDLFGIDIAGLVAEHIGDGVLPVLISRTPKTAERDPDDLTGGRLSGAPQTWECRGFFEDFTREPPPGIEVQLNDRKAVLIGDTIPAGVVIERNDALTIEGQTLYVVQLMSRDPAAAVFTYLCRDRRGPDGV